MNEDIVYNLSKYNNSKFIIYGNGRFIIKLMINYLSKNDSDKKYQIVYYNDFEIELKGKKIYNLLYEVNKESCKNKFKEYFNKKYFLKN